MQGKQDFSKHKTIMIGVQVFIAALAAETDKDIKHLVYNPVGQQCSDWAIESGGNLLFPDHCRKQSGAVFEHLKAVAIFCVQIIAESNKCK